MIHFILLISFLFVPFLNASNSYSSISFTKEEKEFIRNHPIIKASNEMDFPPIDFVVDNKPQGHSIDLLNLLAKKIGIKVEYINGFTWNQLFEKFKAKEIDLLHSLGYTKERAKFGIYSDPYRTDHMRFAVRKDKEDITDFSQLYGKKVAVGDGWYIHQKLSKNYPQIELVVFNSLEEMLKAVISGKVDATIQFDSSISYLIRSKNLHNLKLTGRIKRDGQNYYFMGQKSSPELISILNKALAILTDKEISDLEKKWFTTNKKTVFSEEESLYIKENPEVVASMVKTFPPFAFKEDNEYKGFIFDLLKLLSKTSGLHFKNQLAKSWSESINSFKSKEVDIIFSLSHTKKREAFTLFTDSYFDIPIMIYVHEDFKNYKGIKSFSGKKVGYMKEIYYEKELKKLYNVQLVPFKKPIELYDALANKKIDIAIHNLITANHIINTRKLDKIKLADEFLVPGMKKEDTRIGVVKEKPLLHTIIQKSLSAISEEEWSKLYSKWVGDYASSIISPKQKNLLMLSAEEKTYLQQKSTIKMCVDPDWMPLEMIDKNKKHIGVAAQILNLATMRTNIRLELQPTSSWIETLQKAKNKECDIVSLAMKTKSRLENFNFTKPYLTLPLAVATRDNELFVENIETIKERPLGVIKGFAHIELLKEKYPGINIYEVKNILDGLKKVHSGELFGIIDTVGALAYTIQKNGLTKIKITGHFNENLELGIASRKDEPLLNPIMQKMINTVEESEKQNIYNSWYAVKYEKNVDYELLRKILSVVVLIIIGFLIWNVRINQERKKAKESNRLKSEFVANISHEIRTPLNAVIGFSQLLQKGENLKENDKKYLDSILEGGKSLLGLINDVLDLSKIESSEIKLTPVKVNIEKLVREVAELFTQSVNEKGISLQYKTATNLYPLLLLDELRLKQVLFNIIGNAVKFTQNGSIKIYVKTLKNTDNFVNLEISVQDSGIGIKKEEQEKVFESFVQQNNQDYHKYRGTGLGLSISKKLVNLMGGEISLKSEENKGSCFIVTIPNVSKVDNFDDTKLSNSVVVQFQTCNVLVVDNEKLNRELLTQMLEDEKLIPFIAKNGKEALEVLDKNRIDLIFMDINMPVMDGMECTEKIKENENLKDIPIISFSASIDLNNQKFQKEFFNDSLPKPFIYEDFIEILKKYVPFRVKESKTIIDKNIPKIQDTELLKMVKKAQKSGSLQQVKEINTKIQEITKSEKNDYLLTLSEDIDLALKNFDIKKIKSSLNELENLIKESENGE